jgi:hypothetical protein
MEDGITKKLILLSDFIDVRKNLIGKANDNKRDGI